jgi:hypothetical protein
MRAWQLDQVKRGSAPLPGLLGVAEKGRAQKTYRVAQFDDCHWWGSQISANMVGSSLKTARGKLAARVRGIASPFAAPRATSPAI